MNFAPSHGPSTTPTSGSQSPNAPAPTTPQHVGTNIPHSHSANATPKHQARSPVGADYNRSHFDLLNKNQQPNEPQKKVQSDDVFGDLLGSQGYSFTGKRENMPRTMNAMRKEEMATYMDPEKMKVMEWVSKDLE